ncbi:MAG: hypothetical protein ACHQF0_03550 [Chitinophagales bacterium]
MKKTQLATFILFFFVASLRAQVNETVFQSLDPKAILESLFDASSVDVNGLAAWKPNFSERMYFPVSNDGFCYTKLDTIINFEEASEQNVLLIFKTYLIEKGQPTNVFAMSTAIFNKLSDATRWKVDWFYKEVFYDSGATITGSFKLIKIIGGGNWIDSLNFITERIKNKIITREEYFYSLYNPARIFSCFTYISNTEDPDKAKHFGFRANIKIIPTSSWSILEVSCKGTDRDYPTGKIYDVSGTHRYLYDSNAGAFVRKDRN